MSVIPEVSVSVISPVYNASRYLDECINSVLGQTLRDIELILVDDGSVDDSLQILERWQSLDSRVKVLHQDNAGAAVARNVGLSNAVGEYIMFIDPDDRLASESCLKAMRDKARGGEYPIVAGTINYLVGSKVIAASLYSCSSDRYVSMSEIAHFFGHTRCLFEAKLLVGFNIKYPEVRSFEDPPFMAEAIAAAGGYYSLNLPVYEYRKAYKREVFSPEKTNGYLAGIEKTVSIALKNGMYRAVDHTYGCLDYWPLIESIIKSPDAYRKRLKSIHQLVNDNGAFEATNVPCVVESALSEHPTLSCRLKLRKLGFIFYAKQLLYGVLFR